MLGGGVIRELDGLVDSGEVDQGVEEADPVEASLEHLFLVDVLGQVISDKSVLRWLYTLDGYGDVDN